MLVPKTIPPHKREFLNNSEQQLAKTVSLLETLWQEVVSLTETFYKPKYPLR